MTMNDDPLPESDRPAFDALPRAIDPPPALENRVVDALRTDGTLRAPARASRVWLAAAAALFLVVGFGIGRVSAPSVATAPSGNRYLLLLYGGASASAAEEAARVSEYRAWAGAEASAGRLVLGEKLGETAVALGADPSRASTEPAGFFIIRASNGTDALDIANGCPHLKHGGTVVVRPIVETR